MATIILNTEASVFDHSVRMKFGDVYVLPTTLLNGENLFRLMNFFYKQAVVVFVNQVSSIFLISFIQFVFSLVEPLHCNLEESCEILISLVFV